MTRAMIRDFLLGARLAFAGGRNGWTRTAMTAVGIGIGVALLLAATAVPAMSQARADRTAARSDLLTGEPVSERAGDALLIAEANTEFRGLPIYGRIVRPDGPNAPRPPGVPALPRAGELVVSPALARLLASSDGKLLAERFPARVVGTIAAEGLSGPGEYAFYLGSDTLDPARNGSVTRIDHFGDIAAVEPLHPILMILIVIGFVILLLPVVVFVGAAVRFGGEQRDRRLAALRLVGADRHMVRRIAAGEALLGAALGLALGAALLLLGRQFVGRITLWDISVFPADVRPDPVLATLLVLVVPVLSVGLALLALRGLVAEPLGVVRQSGGTRRRVWWRLALPALGAVLLYPLVGRLDSSGGSVNAYQVAAGTLLLLAGVTTLLPWLVESVVRRLGGGSLAWQLAVRRLQLDSGTAARLISGVAVAVAGAIALQVVFLSAQTTFTTATGQDERRAQILVQVSGDDVVAERINPRFLATPGVRSTFGLTTTGLTIPAEAGGEPTSSILTLTDCAGLREVAVIDRCADGDAFVVESPTESGNAPPPVPRPGQRVRLGGGSTGDAAQWTVPTGLRTVVGRAAPDGHVGQGLYVTPGALGPARPARQTLSIYVGIDPADPDAVERVRNTAAAVSPLTETLTLSGQKQSTRFSTIRRGLFAGVLVTLLLIGVSLLVTTLEQLRERRRVLAVLVAFGTRRAVIGRSVLWQTAVPMALGLALAIGIGTGLGALLLSISSAPVRFDWTSIAAFSGAGAAVVLLVTALSLPALNRLMRAEGLRGE